MNVKKSIDIVYLGMVPPQHKSEGLNVLLSDAIKPMLLHNVDVNIHTTNRHVKKVKEALNGNGVNTDRLNFEIYSIGSIALNVLIGVKRKTAQIGLAKRLMGRVLSLADFITKKILQFSVWSIDLTVINIIPKAVVILLAMFLFAVVSTLVASLGVVFSAVVIPAYIAIEIIRKMLLFVIGKFRPILRPVFRRFIRQLNETRTDLARQLYCSEQKRFAKKINDNKKVKRLFFFTCFEGEVVKAVNCKKLVVFPDAVTLVYPIRFAGQMAKGQIEVMRNAIGFADKLVCYSEHVKKNQLLNYFSNESLGKEIEVIPQGYFKVDDLLTMPKREAKCLLNTQKKYIKNFYPDLMSNVVCVDFNEFDYIVYPTIDRPHKNTLTLLRAYSLLLRKKYLNVKLVLTTPSMIPDVREYIEKERLHHDVIFMPSLPGQVLDILFSGAALMVHPSLAEGGDIFNFSRAVTAGCPALLSDIPVVREMFDRANIIETDYSKWLFEPTDSFGLADMMYSVLSENAEISGNQRHHLENLARYGFGEMSRRYLNCYESM